MRIERLIFMLLFFTFMCLLPAVRAQGQPTAIAEVRIISIGATTFTMEFDGYGSTGDIVSYFWDFGDGTGTSGAIVSHTYSGLGFIYDAWLTVRDAAGFADSVKITVSILQEISQAFLNNKRAYLQNLNNQLSRRTDSLGRIYSALVQAAFKAFEIDDKYGLASPTALLDSLLAFSFAPLAVLPQLSQREFMQMAFLPTVLITDFLKELDIWSLPSFDAGLAQALSSTAVGFPPGTTVADLYNEAENLLVFIGQLIDLVRPAITDTSFILQVPMSESGIAPYGNPPHHMNLDNGDIAGLLGFVSLAKAFFHNLIAYSPGSTIMNFDLSKMSDPNFDITRDIYDFVDAWQKAEMNGVIDLNGSGDGDSDLGFEFLPEDSFTLRSASQLQKAATSLLDAIDLLRIAIEELPLIPGPHDPQIEFPYIAMWILTKSGLLHILANFRAAILGPTQIKLDFDFDGITDYTTVLDLSAYFYTIADLKTLLPDLVATSNPDDPLIVAYTWGDPISDYWKIDGEVSENRATINLPDPTFHGILPRGDLNSILTAMFFPGLVVKGDVNNDRFLDATDIRWIVENILSLRSLTPEQIDRADVALPYGLDVTDVRYLVEAIQGLRTILSASAEGASRPVSSPSTAKRSAKITVKGVEGIAPGEMATICISVSGSSGSSPADLQIGPQGAIRFDPNVIHVKAVRGVGPFQVLQPVLIDNKRGEVRFLAIDVSEQHIQNGAVIELEIEAVGGAGASSPIEITGIDVLRDFEADDIQAEITDGQITLGEATELKISKVASFPNPVRNADTVKFHVEGIGIEGLKVEVFDLSGRRIFESGFALGNSLEWHVQNNAGERLANGVYLYIVTVRGFNGEIVRSEVEKLVILR